jgi:DNA replication licensing factor MCM2
MAAANPIGGRYDASFTLAENVELTDPILQRFDVLCVLQDIVDPVIDEQLATFVVSSHIRSHPDHNHQFDDTQKDNEDEDEADISYNTEDGTSSHLSSMYVGVPKKSQYSHEDSLPPPIDQILLKKYIKYSKTYIKPVLREVDSEKVIVFVYCTTIELYSVIAI